MKNYKNVSGWVDSIYCGSAVDGKGIRVVVFTSGCNLRCPFCHNPETLYGTGKKYSAEELVKRILRYKYYIKNGGVTFSGGEPLLQAEFIEEVTERLIDNGIKSVIETNGTIINENVILKTDYLIVDVKNQETDDLSRYEKLLSSLESIKKTAELTCVIIPSINDTKEKIFKLKSLKERYPSVVTRIKLLPFRKLCREKYIKLSREFLYEKFAECDSKTIEKLTEYL